MELYLFKDDLSLHKTFMWVLQADKPSGTCIIIIYWKRAKTWVFRGKQSWVLRSCFVFHKDFTVMRNKEVFEPLTDTEVVSWKGLTWKNEKLMSFWKDLVPLFQQHFKTLLLKTQSRPSLFTVRQSCTVTSSLTLSEYLRFFLVLSPTVLCIISLFLHWPYTGVLPNQLT